MRTQWSHTVSVAAMTSFRSERSQSEIGENVGNVI